MKHLLRNKLPSALARKKTFHVFSALWTLAPCRERLFQFGSPDFPLLALPGKRNQGRERRKSPREKGDEQPGRGLIRKR